MTGWNLPPGCSINDLPGNRSEDQAAEAVIEEFSMMLDKTLQNPMTDDEFEAVSKWVWDKIDAAWRLGYEQGISDERLAHEEKT